MNRKKKVLIPEAPEMCETLAAFIDRWGYEPAVTSNADSIEEAVMLGQIDLIVLAREMTLKGPSSSRGWRKGDDIEVDFKFGHKIVERLQKQGIDLPIILLTTDDLERNQWVRDEKGDLCSVLIEKRPGDALWNDLKRAIEDFLGEGLTAPHMR